MPSLDTLPLPVLLRLVDDHLTPPLEERTSLDWFRHPERESFFPHKDVVALSSVNKALRESLLPTVFRCVDFGVREPCANPDDVSRVRHLAERGAKVLACVRHVCIFKLFPSHFEWVNKCLEQMSSLTTLEYADSLPFPPLFVPTLKHIPSFHKLYFALGGTEFLPHILPLAPKITHFEVDTIIRRRARQAWDESNVPTVKEQASAFVKGLAPFLLAAKDNLEHVLLDAEDLCDFGSSSQAPSAFLAMFGGGGGGENQKKSSEWLQCLFDAMVNDDRAYPIFRKLERLSIKGAEFRCLGFRHLLRTSGANLTHLEMVSVDQRELQEPKEAMRRLKMLTLVLDDAGSANTFLPKVVSEAPLHELVLNGLKPIDVPKLFSNPFPCGATLYELRLVGMPLKAFSLEAFRKIVAACPNLELFLFKGCYSGEAVDYLSALTPLHKLRRFDFDHPFTKPRNFPFPEPDGRTIRSERNGDFRIVSVMAGQSVEEVVRGRIKADLAAVKPIYVKHFTSLARQNPSLEELKWHATEKVLWKWTFWREPFEGGTRLRFRQKAEIDYPETGEVSDTSAVMMLERRG